MIPGIPGVTPVQNRETPMELVVKQANMQVGRMGQHFLLRFTVPEAGLTISIPLEEAAAKTLASQLNGNIVIPSPVLPG